MGGEGKGRKALELFENIFGIRGKGGDVTNQNHAICGVAKLGFGRCSDPAIFIKLITTRDHSEEGEYEVLRRYCTE